MIGDISRARARLRGVIKAVIRSERGAAAVEMALVATPFFMLLFGIIEVGMVFLISASLENGMDIAARTIRTGQFQTGATPTAAAFKTTICNTFGWFQADCTANLYVDVRTFSTFSSITAPQPVSNGSFNTSALTFSPGGPNDIVVVRAYYQWPLIAPFFDAAMQQLNGGVAVLTSTFAFRNEPYSSS
jgi:Flp pilus assembly protein TadG